MTAYRNEVFADGPVAFWPMADEGGSVTDLIGGKVAVLTGNAGSRAIPYPGTMARDLDGWGSFFEVSAADSVGLSWAGGDYTIEWWAMADSLGQDAIISQRNNASDGSQGISIMLGTGPPGVFGIDMGASNSRASVSGYTVAVGEWKHYVFTWSESLKERRFYVDGDLVYYGITVNSSPPTIQPPIRIGSLGGNLSYAWDGLIGGLALYQKQLSTSQVRTHFLASGAKGVNVRVGETWRRKPVLRKVGARWVPTAIGGAK